MRISRAIATLTLVVAAGVFLHWAATHNVSLTRAPAQASETRAITDLRGQYHPPRNQLTKPDQSSLLVPAEPPQATTPN